MFDNRVFESGNLSKNIRRLFDDAGIGYHINDTTLPVAYLVLYRMTQGKGQRGQSLTAAGGD